LLSDDHHYLKEVFSLRLVTFILCNSWRNLPGDNDCDCLQNLIVDSTSNLLLLWLYLAVPDPSCDHYQLNSHVDVEHSGEEDSGRNSLEDST
jgi:hypothetical protein